MRTSSALASVVIALTVTLIVPRTHALQTQVFVSTAPELYEAVNDPDNAGAQVVLTAGTYALDPHAPLNGGRLELQENMELVGVDGDAGGVIIDATPLETGSYQNGADRTGAVRMGRGHNVIEWLTVKNDRFGGGEIVTDLAPTSTPTSIRVAHVVASGGQRGIDARFTGAAFNNRTVVAVFEDNVLEHNVRGIGQGMRMLITGATGATLRVTLHGNVFNDNKLGLLAANQASLNTILIDSSADRFSNNRAGCWLIGGLIGGALTTSSSNVLRFTANGDEFRDNSRPPDAAFPQFNTGGGVVGIGGANLSNSNVVSLDIANSQFSGNANADISAFGYNELGTVAGTNNRVGIERLAGTGAAILATIPSLPADPGHTNAVVLPSTPWVGLKNSDDVGTKFDLLGEVLYNTSIVGSGQLAGVHGGSSGFNNARLNAIDLTLSEPVTFSPGDLVSFRLSARVAVSSGHSSGTARLWFNDAAANSAFAGYFLRASPTLAVLPGPGPKATADVTVNRSNGNPFKPFGTWTAQF